MKLSGTRRRLGKALADLAGRARAWEVQGWDPALKQAQQQCNLHNTGNKMCHDARAVECPNTSTLGAT